jgi:hypothetical protein
MMPLSSQQLAELHRETYVAIIESWVPHGQRGAYARRAEISREYLSNLLALDPPAGARYATQRWPSPPTARRLAEVLPAPAEFRQSLFEHMAQAHQYRHAEQTRVRRWVEQRRVDELLAEMRAGHGLATFGREVRQTERAYRALRDVAASALTLLSPALYPAAFAQTCLFLHDAACVLDRAEEALYHARLAHLVLQSGAVHEPRFTQPQIDELLINTIRGEGIAYHNLGLDQRVPQHCAEAEATPAYRQAGAFWQPVVGRDRLNAMANTPRFSRRAARDLAHALMARCERASDAFTLFLVREAWLRCLIQAERWEEAHRVLSSELDLLPQLPYAGPLHHALLLKTAAQLAWRQADATGWRENARAFVRLARGAGLKHQLRLAQRMYGPALTRIADEVEAETGAALTTDPTQRPI